MPEELWTKRKGEYMIRKKTDKAEVTQAVEGEQMVEPKAERKVPRKGVSPGKEPPRTKRRSVVPEYTGPGKRPNDVWYVNEGKNTVMHRNWSLKPGEGMWVLEKESVILGLDKGTGKKK